MIHIIHGERFVHVIRGWDIFKCPRCNCAQLFLVETLVKRSHFYFIDLPEVVLGEVITCDFCDSKFKVPQIKELQFNKNWSRSNLIEFLEKSNSPIIKGIIKKSNWNNQELIATLVSMQEKSSMENKYTNFGFWLGTIVFAILGVATVKLAYYFGFKLGPFDELLPIFLSILIGGFLGGFVGLKIAQIVFTRSVHQKALTSFLNKHKVPIKLLIKAATTTNINLKKILAVCEDEQKKTLNFK